MAPFKHFEYKIQPAFDPGCIKHTDDGRIGLGLQKVDGDRLNETVDWPTETTIGPSKGCFVHTIICLPGRTPIE